jgi:antitoxin VapB
MHPDDGGGKRIRTALALDYTAWYRSGMTVAKVFMNGRSQAIRLPLEFRVRTDEVYLKRTTGGFLVVERDPWEIFEEGCRELSEDFLAGREQPPLEEGRWKK